MRHVHFIGIGGVGMSGLAQALMARGVRVSGSDPLRNAATDRLEAAGARIYRVQSAENIELEHPDIVVVTPAVQEANEELVAARRTGIPVLSRAQMLGRMMAESPRPRVAVAGTHGKTTTTSMLAEILVAAGLDPTVLVGAEYAGIGGNARVGSGPFLTEACEAFDSFLALSPDVAVITNIEADHLDWYLSEERLADGFRQFLDRTSPDGAVVWCADDPGVRRVVPRALGPRESLPYGLWSERQGTLRARVLSAGGGRTEFAVWRFGRAEELGRVALPVPGSHNVLNALGALGTALWMGVPFDTAARALERFQGAERRFDVLGERGGVLVVDDYAHHPTEVRATLAAARSAYPDRRVVAVFQPHLYSRTRDFMDEFAAALTDADAVVVTDIYPAREEPIPGVSAADLVERIAGRRRGGTVLYMPCKGDVPRALEWLARPGDLVLTMGAGDIREAGLAYLSAFPAAL